MGGPWAGLSLRTKWGGAFSTNQLSINLARTSCVPWLKDVFGKGQCTANIIIHAVLTLFQMLGFDERGIFLQFRISNKKGGAKCTKRNCIWFRVTMTSTPKSLCHFDRYDFFSHINTELLTYLLVSLVKLTKFLIVNIYKNESL